MSNEQLPPDQPERPTIQSVFQESLDALTDLELSESGREGHYRVLANFLNGAIHSATLYGEPADDGINALMDPLRRAIHSAELRDTPVRERLLGMFDIAFDAASYVPRQIDQNTYEELATLSNVPAAQLVVPREQYNNGTLDAETLGKLRVYQGLASQGCAGIRWFGDNMYAEITPRGRATLAAHERRMAREAQGS